ncbi:MAG: hypothetical protein ACKPKO_57915, partial [Candidatus Fonsibacter sp.]
KVMRKVSFELSSRADDWQPTLHEDRLNITMKAIRMYERGDNVKALDIIRNNHELNRVVGDTGWPRAKTLLKDHAIQLFAASTQEKVDDLKRARDTLPEFEYNKRK